MIFRVGDRVRFVNVTEEVGTVVGLGYDGWPIVKWDKNARMILGFSKTPVDPRLLEIIDVVTRIGEIKP